jgi:hypothetical protein
MKTKSFRTNQLIKTVAITVLVLMQISFCFCQTKIYDVKIDESTKMAAKDKQVGIAEGKNIYVANNDGSKGDLFIKVDGKKACKKNDCFTVEVSADGKIYLIDSFDETKKKCMGSIKGNKVYKYCDLNGKEQPLLIFDGDKKLAAIAFVGGIGR